jgi:hypothetical protein
MKPNDRLNRFLAFSILLIAIVLVAAVAVIKIPLATAFSPTPPPTGTAFPTPTDLPAVLSGYPTVVPMVPSDTPPASYRQIDWMELVSFLEKDHTNWNQYILGKYTCVNFAVDLAANAGRQNIKTWIVLVEFTDGGPGHAFVAFQTTDRGIIYVEPQGDNTYSVVEVGKPLCDEWGVYQCMGTVASVEYAQCDSAQNCIQYTP